MFGHIFHRNSIFLLISTKLISPISVYQRALILMPMWISDGSVASLQVLNMSKYPLTPLRFVTHIFGHADWKHFVGLLVKKQLPGHERIRGKRQPHFLWYSIAPVDWTRLWFLHWTSYMGVVQQKSMPCLSLLVKEVWRPALQLCWILLFMLFYVAYATSKWDMRKLSWFVRPSSR